MNNHKTFLKAASVIKSCTTKDQLDTYLNWVNNIRFVNTGDNIYEAMNYKLDLKGLVIDMNQYLIARANVGLLDDVKFGIKED